MPYVQVKMTEAEKEMIEYKASLYGFVSVSEYVRFVSINCEVKVEVPE